MKELIEIQSELKAPKNQRNSFGNYNYRSCEDILESLKPLLKKHQCILYLTEKTKELAGQVIIEASVVIVNKDYVEMKCTASAGVDFQAKGMQTPQRFGAASSYARKYALGGLFLLDDTKDADATNTHGKTADNKEYLTLTHDKFSGAKEYIANGGNIEDIKKKYNLSKEVEKELLK